MPPAATKGYNHVLNHVAISVPDCDAAVEWYTTVLGFRNLRPDRTTSRARDPEASIFKIYGDGLQEVKMAWLGTGNSVGFEVFEFINPKYKGGPAFDYARGGFFHIAVTVPEPEVLAEKVVKAGGKRIGLPVQLYDGDSAVYVQDPWGNVVELLSCSMEQLMANRE